MAYLLRDGSRTADPRLDLVFDKDPGNLNYPIAAVAPQFYERVDRQHPRSPVTNQGEEGACVGHGYTGWCAACSLLPQMATPELDAYALGYYFETQVHDEWVETTGQPGGPGGTSVKAGAQTAVRRGLITEFRWAFGLDEALHALTTVGPLVLGVPWLAGMYQAPEGRVVLAGKQVGAHCIKADAVFWSTEEVEWQNSWGLEYGVNGRARISFRDLDTLLRNGGEACVPIAPVVDL